jgi:undecaprenyl-diphosphatase
MLDTLINFDRNFFLALNSLHAPWLDPVMFWVSGKLIWLPLYIALAVFLYRKFGTQSIFMILFAAILITLSDQLSVMLKNFFERERPCHDETIAFLVHTVNGKCGGKYGFVSSHAANTMAVFTYLLCLARNQNRAITLITAFWVALVGFSRIYMGVHYPADIMGGWIIGVISAGITYVIYRLIFDSPFMHLKK